MTKVLNKAAITNIVIEIMELEDKEEFNNTYGDYDTAFDDLYDWVSSTPFRVIDYVTDLYQSINEQLVDQNETSSKKLDILELVPQVVTALEKY